MTDPHEIAARLTEAQRWAITGISLGHGISPSSLGQWMMERDGASPRRAGATYKAQAYGRMGAGMMQRLRKIGLVETGGWPTRAFLTSLGQDVRDVLLAAEKESG